MPPVSRRYRVTYSLIPVSDTERKRVADLKKKQKKPALKGMQKPTPALFFVPRDLEV